jgi:hypothetical protein
MKTWLEYRLPLPPPAGAQGGLKTTHVDLALYAERMTRDCGMGEGSACRRAWRLPACLVLETPAPSRQDRKGLLQHTDHPSVAIQWWGWQTMDFESLLRLQPSQAHMEGDMDPPTVGLSH